MEVILMKSLKEEIGRSIVEVMPKKGDSIIHDGKKYIVIETVHASPRYKVIVFQDTGYSDVGFKL